MIMILNFSVGSRTLWLGRLPSNCHDDDIKNALADCGRVDRIQIINSRACGYVTMQGIIVED